MRGGLISDFDSWERFMHAAVYRYLRVFPEDVSQHGQPLAAWHCCSFVNCLPACPPCRSTHSS